MTNITRSSIAVRIALLATALGACSEPDSGESPSIQSFTLDDSMVAVGQQVTLTGTVTFRDEGGDVESFDIEVRPPSGAALTTSVDLQGGEGMENGTAQLLLAVVPAVAGEYVVVATAIDAEGNASEPAQTMFTAQ